MTQPTAIDGTTTEEWEEYRDAISDMLCWFQGFQAVGKKRQVRTIPPSIDRIRSLNIRIREHLR